ncbi:hypothetical protein FNH22_13420 [Fulvivirga sp. M361]|uniref:hypothetical protein n=1 Tax=Fulvivirga sp. M361 TaxID=2594266 RepID=UPI00117B06C0|nr:hypothetical protein [Fulvivirga sp. M361]TRX58866.1 hypothetical protein FNH22_13420 [Fulvivirga sp. M361]
MNRISIVATITILLINIFFGGQAIAQAPSKMSYQAVIRDAGGDLVTEKTIGMQISILSGSVEGTPTYIETHTPETNANGLISLEIGTGLVSSGSFDDIDWANHDFFIKTEVDIEGGTTYTITGTSQLLSVPYALYAKSAGNTFSGSYNDLSDVPDSFDGEFSSLTNIPDGLSDGDDDTQLTEAEVDAFVDNNGYLTAEVDGSVTNELELPSQTGQSGKYLKTDGSSVSWSSIGPNVRTISANTTLLNTDEIVFINGPFTARLPAAPTDGTRITICAIHPDAVIDGNGRNIHIASVTLVSFPIGIANANQYVFIYSSTLNVWVTGY